MWLLVVYCKYEVILFVLLYKFLCVNIVFFGFLVVFEVYRIIVIFFLFSLGFL